MKIRDKILQYFNDNQDVTITSLVDYLLVSKQYVHRVLNDFLAEGIIIKLGSSPKTFYRLAPISNEKSVLNINISADKIRFLDKNFMVITEIGQLLTGLDAFENWCNKRALPIEKTLDEYITTLQKYHSYYNENQLISGIDKLKSTKGYEKIYMKDLFYLDFYAIERFGKTRLGTILHYAKQGQNKMLMKILIDEIKTVVYNLLEIYKIDAIVYVPPTIKRETQLMKVLANGLKINKPQIDVQKIGGIIPVPQKSLNKLQERIANADNTFVIKSNISYTNVLLIDDAVGSGSTLNQIAKKITDNKLATNIYGLAIVGSYKGFEVITDV